MLALLREQLEQRSAAYPQPSVGEELCRKRIKVRGSSARRNAATGA